MFEGHAAVGEPHLESAGYLALVPLCTRPKR